jgi:hypothetical protein
MCFYQPRRDSFQHTALAGKNPLCSSALPQRFVGLTCGFSFFRAVQMRCHRLLVAPHLLVRPPWCSLPPRRLASRFLFECCVRGRDDVGDGFDLRACAGARAGARRVLEAGEASGASPAPEGRARRWRRAGRAALRAWPRKIKRRDGFRRAASAAMANGRREARRRFCFPRTRPG